MGTPVPALTEPSHKHPAVCLPSPVCLPVCLWQLSAVSDRSLYRPPAVSPPLLPSLTLTLPPSLSEPEPPQWEWPDPELGSDPCSESHHRIRQEPQFEAAVVLVHYPRVRTVRGDGFVLSDDGIPTALRILNWTGLSSCHPEYLAPAGGWRMGSMGWRL